MADELNVGMKCIKYMLFVANFMFVMIGFLLISIGSTIKAIYQDFDVFMESHYFSPSELAIAIGIIMFLVALFGCVGAIKESTCLINMFSVFLTCILILEVAAAIAAYTMRTNLERNIRIKMEESLPDYYNPNATLITDMWDFTQDRLRCCGVDTHRDWLRYAPPLPTTSTTPAKSSTTDVSATSPADIAEEGDENEDKGGEDKEKEQEEEDKEEQEEQDPADGDGSTTEQENVIDQVDTDDEPELVRGLPSRRTSTEGSTDPWVGPSSCCRRHRNDMEGSVCITSDTWRGGCLDQLTYIVSECALLLGCGALAVAFIQMLGIVFAHMLARAVRRLKTQNLVDRERYRQQLYEQMAKGEDTKPTPVLYTSPESEA